MQLDQLYQDIILDHTKEPRNFGELKPADSSEEGFNPVCGDRVVIDVNFEGEKKGIKDIRFRGEGCSICMSSASMLTEEVEGLDLAEVDKKIAYFRELMKGSVDPDSVEGDIQSLAGVRKFPVRIKCALLPWMTLKDAIGSKEEVEFEA